MSPLRQIARSTSEPDRFRGTVQRWSIEAGPLAGTICDHAFNNDWSLTWRMVAGDRQGQVGRAREFVIQPVSDQVFLVSFATTPGVSVTAAVDFKSRRLTGVQTGPGYLHPMGGNFRTM